MPDAGPPPPVGPGCTPGPNPPPACGAGTGGTLTGTVKAPPGHSVKGTAVIACLVTSNGDCDQQRSLFAVIASDGPSASYRIDGLVPGGFIVLAWADRNGNTDVDAGDLIGVFSLDGVKVTEVRPPANGVDLTMAEEQGAPTPPAAAAPPAELVGYWKMGPVEDYRINADGTYEYTWSKFSSVGPCIQQFTRLEKGILQVQGDAVTFNFTSGSQLRMACTTTESYNRPLAPGSKSFTYRISDRLLYLKDAMGYEATFLKQ